MSSEGKSSPIKCTPEDSQSQDSFDDSDAEEYYLLDDASASDSSDSDSDNVVSNVADSHITSDDHQSDEMGSESDPGPSSSSGSKGQPANTCSTSSTSYSLAQFSSRNHTIYILQDDSSDDDDIISIPPPSKSPPPLITLENDDDDDDDDDDGAAAAAAAEAAAEAAADEEYQRIRRANNGSTGAYLFNETLNELNGDSGKTRQYESALRAMYYINKVQRQASEIYQHILLRPRNSCEFQSLSSDTVCSSAHSSGWVGQPMDYKVSLDEDVNCDNLGSSNEEDTSHLAYLSDLFRSCYEETAKQKREAEEAKKVETPAPDSTDDHPCQEKNDSSNDSSKITESESTPSKTPVHHSVEKESDHGRKETKDSDHSSKHSRDHHLPNHSCCEKNSSHHSSSGGSLSKKPSTSVDGAKKESRSSDDYKDRHSRYSHRHNRHPEKHSDHKSYRYRPKGESRHESYKRRRDNHYRHYRKRSDRRSASNKSWSSVAHSSVNEQTGRQDSAEEKHKKPHESKDRDGLKGHKNVGVVSSKSTRKAGSDRRSRKSPHHK